MITASALIAGVSAVVSLAQYVPSIIQSFEDLINLVKNHGELSAEQKAYLLAQLASTAVKVAAYQPRPKPV